MQKRISVKSFFNFREVRMLLHLVSIFIFSIPATTHILKLILFDDEAFKINGYAFSSADSFLLILFILLIVSVNIYSIMTDRGHGVSMLVTGIFLLTLTLVQLGVQTFQISMEVFGKTWPISVSARESIVTGSLSLLLL